MKEVVIEKIVKETQYEAIDGTIFINREECINYDNTARAVLLSKYNKLVLKRMSEYALFGSGSDDYELEIISVNNSEDIKTVMQLIGLENHHLLKKEYQDKYNKYMETLEYALKNNDLVFIYRGYVNDNFCIDGTLKDRLEYITNACKIDKDNIKEFLVCLKRTMNLIVRHCSCGGGDKQIAELAEIYKLPCALAITERVNAAERALYFNGNVNVVTDGILLSILEEKYRWQKL